jgi:hypothetical protein
MFWQGSKFFFSTLTKVNPFDFEDLSERAEFIFLFGDGETIVGYCFERDKRLAGLARAVAGKGVFVHQLY